ncbi:hypothetical protein [Pontibacter sp. H249]|uniref:hypothetical protein n=1 Tax=Pontibacter sp. H249 TaxID=3133420 RepID=UPI0030BFC8D0
MKQLLLLICVLFATNVYAKIIRVNNQEPTNPQQSTYASLQDAYDNAQAGDTIYIEGSTVSYGSLTVSKKLTLIGPGYFLAENVNTQANVQPAVLHQVTVQSGAEGSKLIGLSISQSASACYDWKLVILKLKRAILEMEQK